MTFRVFVIALALLAAPGAFAGEQTVYKWTDERGVVHFSDTGMPKRFRGEEQRVEGRPVAGPPAAAQGKWIPLTQQDGKRVVRVQLEGAYRTREVTMVVDTGASMTMIDEDLAEELQMEFVDEAGIVGVTGVAPGWVGRLRRLRLGDHELTDLPIMVGPLPGVALLGNDVLDRLQLTVGPDRLEAKAAAR